MTQRPPCFGCNVTPITWTGQRTLASYLPSRFEGPREWVEYGQKGPTIYGEGDGRGLFFLGGSLARSLSLFSLSGLDDLLTLLLPLLLPS
jgi:hypothetical protein